MVCVGLKTKGLGIDNKVGKKPRVAGSTAPLLLSLSSFPLFFSLFRKYQWERSQAPTVIVPDLMGLPLQSGTDRAQSFHLKTKILESTWYTNLSPGRITLQSPEAGQRVPYHTPIGVEVATAPPVLAS